MSPSTIISTLNDGNQDKTKRIQELLYVTTDNENLTKKALQDAMTALKDAGKHSKSEQSKVIKDKVHKRISSVIYRNVTFARDEELRSLTVKIFNDLDGKLEGIAHDEFVRIYESHVQECLSQRRQYTQTQLFDAMKTWHKKHDSMPPVEWFDKPCDIPKSTDSNCQKRKEFAIWFWLHWLPAAGGAGNWPLELRKYRLSVQSIKKVPGKEDMTGPHVTIEREAFATIVTKNCHGVSELNRRKSIKWSEA